MGRFRGNTRTYWLFSPTITGIMRQIPYLNRIPGHILDTVGSKRATSILHVIPVLPQQGLEARMVAQGHEAHASVRQAPLLSASPLSSLKSLSQPSSMLSGSA